jgi:HSP20 family protein
MSLIKYNNRTIAPGIFQLLNDVVNDDFNTPSRSVRREFNPAVNVKETDKSFEIEMAVPGIEKKDINVEVEKEVLTISSEMKDEKNEEFDNYSRREFHFTSFKRSFKVPKEAEVSKIEAKQENGVLSIKIPKKEEKVNLKKMIKVA